MKYDFHVHTSRYSPCSMETPEALCIAALERGLRGIALTEHECWWPEHELELLRLRFPELVLFRGSEYTCNEGHFLVFVPEDLEDLPPYHTEVLQLIDAVHQRSGVVIWAHPFRFGEPWSEWVEQADLDGVEISSSNMDGRTGRLARRVAEERGFRVFQNSDTHSLETIGRYYNEFPVDFRSTSELIQSLRRPNAG
ncbi:MAG: PHP-associated domain-containing protein [Syntrophobacteraceae bacterium]